MDGGDLTMSCGLSDGEVAVEDAQLAQDDALTEGGGITNRQSLEALEQETVEQYAIRMQKEAVARVNARLSQRPDNRRSWQLQFNSQGQLIRTDNSEEDKGIWVAPASWNVIR
jgi:hypothetical protein